MKFLPSEKITYVSSLGPNDVLDKLRKVTEPKKYLRQERSIGDNYPFQFEGKFDKYTFSIIPNSSYQNTLAPIIDGKVESTASGSRVRVEMYLSDGNAVLMIGWSVSCVLTLGLSILAMKGHIDVQLSPIIPVVLFLFGHILSLFAFNSGVNNSKTLLAKLFDARIENLKVVQ